MVHDVVSAMTLRARKRKINHIHQHPKSKIKNSQHLALVGLHPYVRDLISTDVDLGQITDKVDLQFDQKVPLRIVQVRIVHPILVVGGIPKEQNRARPVLDPKRLLPLLHQYGSKRDATQDVSGMQHLFPVGEGCRVGQLGGLSDDPSVLAGGRHGRRGRIRRLTGGRADHQFRRGGAAARARSLSSGSTSSRYSCLPREVRPSDPDAP